MAAKDDDPAPLDLSMRRNNDHNEGTNNPPNRNRPRRFPPAPLSQTMGAPRSTSFESYSHSQAHQADAQYFSRGLQPAPGQFFNPENVLNLDPQPKPPVPPTNDLWNLNRNNNYSNNQKYNQTPNPGNININGNNGSLGFRLPWINPYENNPYQSNLNNYHLLRGAQMLMPKLFPFQPNPTPNPSLSCQNYGNSPYEHPHCSHRCEQPASSTTTTCHPPPTHSSFNNCCAQNHSAYHREETQGDNGFTRNSPEVISLVSSGSIKIDTDDGDVTFLGYSSSIRVGNEAGNENEIDRDERPPVLTPHGPDGIPGPYSTNFDDRNYSTDDQPPPQLSPQVPFPGPSSIYPQPDSQDIRSDAASNRKENVAVPPGISSLGVSRPGSGRCPSPMTEVTAKEPADKIRVLQFGVRQKTDKPVPSNFEKTVSEKSGRSAGEKSLKNSRKGDKASEAIPSPRATRGNKGPTPKTVTPQNSPVPVMKSSGAASCVQQSERRMELRQDASSQCAPFLSRKKGSRKRVNWLLVHPETDRNELDSLFGQLE